MDPSILDIKGELFQDKEAKVTDGEVSYKAKLTFWPWGKEVQARLTLERLGEANEDYEYLEPWVSGVLDATGHFFETSAERDVYNHSSECGHGDCPLLR